MTVEGLYKEYIEKEPVVIEAMANNGTYIRLEEGYPDKIQEPDLPTDELRCKITS